MFSTLATIALLHWAVLLIPGFNFILIGQLAAGGGRRAALAAGAGMTTGTLTWASLAVAGVGIVFSAHPSLRAVVQIAGGLYLLQLAFRLWRSGGTAADQPAPSMGGAAAFRTGFATSLLNPKIALFYGSVFATAMPAQPSTALVTSAVVLVVGNSALYHASLALLLSRRSVQQAWLRHQRLLNRASGLLVGAYGAKLIASAINEVRSTP